MADGFPVKSYPYHCQHVLSANSYTTTRTYSYSYPISTRTKRGLKRLKSSVYTNTNGNRVDPCAAAASRRAKILCHARVLDLAAAEIFMWLSRIPAKM